MYILIPSFTKMYAIYIYMIRRNGRRWLLVKTTTPTPNALKPTILPTRYTSLMPAWTSQWNFPRCRPILQSRNLAPTPLATTFVASTILSDTSAQWPAHVAIATSQYSIAIGAPGPCHAQCSFMMYRLDHVLFCLHVTCLTVKNVKRHVTRLNQWIFLWGIYI